MFLGERWAAAIAAGEKDCPITGTCVCCNRCQPYPAGIDIGLVNKYYDLAKAGDLMLFGLTFPLPAVIRHWDIWKKRKV